MKKFYKLKFIALEAISSTMLFCFVNQFGYSQTNEFSNFQNDYRKFIENQKTPFLQGNGEVFVLDGTAWERTYGEKEYVLTPVMQNIKEYNMRIRQLDDVNNGITKSKFHIINVELTSFSKPLLQSINISVPDYISGNVNISLPEIDIDKLTLNNVKFKYLNDYGKKIGIINNPKNTNNIIFSEDFETNSVPGSFYTTTKNLGVDCGWKDVSCESISGSWSVWCAGDGTVCNTCGNGYVNDMYTELWKTNAINTNNYTDLMFAWFMKYDLNDINTTDDLSIYHDFGSGWILGDVFNSSSVNEGLSTWSFFYITFSGTFSTYKFEFDFYSNSSFTSAGVYIDDIQLTGTPSSGINNNLLNANINIYPNPSNDKFTLQLKDNTFNINDIEIFNVLGEKIYQSTNSQIKELTTIDLSSQPSGIYTVQVKTENGTSIQKLIINK